MTTRSPEEGKMRRLLIGRSRVERVDPRHPAAAVRRGRLPHRGLPTSLPESDRVRFAWQYHPCDELAGDSLNVHRLDPRHISLYVINVSGHGVPAALLSVSVTRSLEPSADPFCLVTGPDDAVASPADVARRLNTLYPMESNGNEYFTMAYGVLDQETGRFRFTLAGHPGPILIRKGARPEQLGTPSLVIGALEDVTFTESEVELGAGDRLYLFSDVLYEERNATAEQFGLPRLIQALAGRANEPLEEPRARAPRPRRLAGVQRLQRRLLHPRHRDAGHLAPRKKEKRRGLLARSQRPASSRLGSRLQSSVPGSVRL